jgi:Recombination endonuclease VII
LKKKANEWKDKNRDRYLKKKKEWYRSNKEKSKTSARRSYFRIMYGTTPEEMEAMLKAQGNSCAICSTDTPGGKGWHLDHCHAAGHARGVLCNHCNLMLGYARDNPATLAAAIAYLGRR